MAPMAISDSITDPTHIDVGGNVEVEDVIVAGAGPAGLMLAYVVFSGDRHHIVLIKPAQVDIGLLWHSVESVRRPC